VGELDMPYHSPASGTDGGQLYEARPLGACGGDSRMDHRRRSKT
jgi:hypothetical protein